MSPPAIVFQVPGSTNPAAAFHGKLTLSVSAQAGGQSSGVPLTYQWRFNGKDIGRATSSSYTLLGSQEATGTYTVLVANGAGTTSATWKVSMTYAGSYTAPGTLAYHLSTNAVGHAVGYSAVYSNMLELANWAPATYSGTNLALLTHAVWSSHCWLHGVRGLSATCIGYSNGYSGQFLVTMISPRHYLRAQHTGTPRSPIAFLATNNVLYWRKVVDQIQVGVSDTAVGMLDTDLPASVGYLPILPANYTNYLPTTGSSYVQAIGLHQDLSLFSQPMRFWDPNSVVWDRLIAPPFGLTTNWNIALYSGDSSNPDMLLIGNQLVLVTHHAAADGGPNYAPQISAINQRMHYLSTNNHVRTDYRLTTFPLGNWPVIH
ncbi:MAG: hypothetical protein C5B50_29820 [Verrucomicrobia bacterium]|nr:MAG: hypothetical protein C5B50_29820 [Verrucomicrobiota bacterium]